MACATSNAAALSSTVRALMKFCEAKSWLRLWLAWAMDNSALLCATWAMGSWSSNCTNNCPCLIRSPSLKFNCVMRPPTSGRTITLRLDLRFPTAWVSSTKRITSILLTSTLGALPPAGAEAPALGALAAVSGAWDVVAASPRGLCWNHQAAPDAAAIPAAATTVYRVFDAMVSAFVSQFLSPSPPARANVLHANG